MNPILDFLNDFNKGKVDLDNKTLDKKIKQYKLFYISTNNYFLNQNVKLNIKQSSVIIVDKFSLQNQKSDDDYNFIISFQKTIIIISHTFLKTLENLFSCNSDLSLCFLSDTKTIFDQNIDLKYNEIQCHPTFREEIHEFNNKLFAVLDIHKRCIWCALNSSISAYFIMKSYLKKNKDRINEFFSNPKNSSISIKDDSDYIELRLQGAGISFSTYLIYHIENEELLIIKKLNGYNPTSILIEREISNYTEIKHPFIPSFYGFFELDYNKVPIIEFINGHTLLEYPNKLNDNEKITILFQLMIVIEYLHNNNFIYRDLKPNNVMLDKNKSIVLIDFDRMIKFDSNFNDENHTADLSSIFIDPNTSTNNFSYEVDIFSIGQMIFYLMNEKVPNQENCSKLNNFGNYPKMKELYERCTNNSRDERPTISELIQEFYENFKSQISINQKLIEIIQKLKFERKIPILYTLREMSKSEDKHKKFISNMFLYFKYKFFDCSLKDEETQKILLKNLIETHKFITYQIHEINDKNSQTKIVNAVFCVENYFFIFYSIQRKLVIQTLNNLNSVFINTGEGMELNIINDISLIFQIISASIPDNEIINLAFNSVLTYLIRRFYYPSYLFENPSFFFFEKNIDASNVNQFDESDFLIFKNLNSRENNSHLAFHIPSLYLFVIKKNYYKKGCTFCKSEIDFCKKISYRYLTPFYGFIFKESKITGFVYKFMSNGSLKSYMEKNKDKIPKIFSFLSASRILLGIDYLHSKSIPHSILKPSNILIDHDNLAYISEYEIIYRKNNKNESSNDISNDINSFGMILSYLFLRKDSYNTYKSRSKKQFYEWPKNLKDIENIFKMCTKFRSNEKSKLEQIETMLSESSDYFFVSTKNISDYKINEFEYNRFACQYIYDLLLLEVQTKKKPNTIKLTENIYNYISLTFNQSSCYIFMAHLYMNSKDELKNIDKALHFYNLAADYGNVEALMILGNIYLEGIITIVDIPRAKEYFNRAAEKGNSEALFQLGNINWNDGKIQEAIELYKKAADKGNPSALLKLGNLYYYGDVFTKDLKKAIDYYFKSSCADNDEALLMLGDMYYKGEGFKKNYLKAFECYQHSYNRNNSFASYRLGTMYYNGSGFDVNIEKAIGYFKTCIILNDQENYKFLRASLNGSRNDLGTIYITESKFYNEDNGFKYLTAAASSGEYQHGYNNLGIFYDFYKNDCKSAEEYFKRASEKEFTLADFNLARLYERLNQTEESINYYIKASDNENTSFKYQNSIIYDKRLEHSKSFVICLANLKLTLYFLSKQKNDEAKEYFLRAIRKQIFISKNEFLCKMDKNAFSFLKSFILDNYEESKLNPNDLKKSNLQAQIISLSIFNTFAFSQIFNELNMGQLNNNEKIKNDINFNQKFNKLKFDENDDLNDNADDDNDEGNLMICDAEKFFDYAIQDVVSFFTGIHDIITEMSLILYNHPYRILLGRILITEKKIHFSQINDSFYEGIGSDVLKMMSVNHIYEYEKQSHK